MISLEQALRAQKALRQTAGLGEQIFPLPAFVGMVSDEVEALSRTGHDDATIVEIVRQSSGIVLSVEQLQENYATPEQCHQHHDD